MKHFNEYFFESLSKESIKKLEQYISDENVDEYIKLLKENDIEIPKIIEFINL